MNIRVVVVKASILVLLPVLALGQTNIDSAQAGEAYGWGENVGWSSLVAETTNGVVVSNSFLSGFSWLENCGWMNFGDGTPAGPGGQYTNTSATDFGVNNDGTGRLSGYAWCENTGWISFDTSANGGSQVVIDSVTGRFQGYAWAENIGWIAFTGLGPWTARTSWQPTASVAEWIEYE